MPPNRFSRHRFTLGVKDDDGNLFLTERVPFGYRERSDNKHHLVRTGDTLYSLAGRYFSAFERAAGLWWVIADFQPDPIHDPTLALEVGRVLVIPSLRTVQEEIFNERRRASEREA